MERKSRITKWLTLDSGVVSKCVAGKDGSQRVKLAPVKAFSRRQQAA